ncbi:copia protein [Trichonephila clavipes]|uniref:Copia protein n=1 Tax=Trichonephila clavipes TaxID=2585209 RepID=A0A8X6RZZ8_TRICX|nr:copia protein [Trichonephila clavipes]
MAVSSYQIKPLESSNYATWSKDVRFLLHEKNCFEIVAGKETAPDSKEENRRELKDFNIRQRLALSILYLNISTEYRSIIENVTDPVEAWKLLRDNFRPDNRSYHLKLFGEFFQCRIQPNEKLNIFSSRIKRICDQLEEMGKPMEETYQCYQLLKCLPSKFDSIVQNILRWTDETFKYKDVLLEVIAEETRIDFRDGLSLQRNQHEMFSVQKSKIKCHYCGKFGHFRRECRNGTAASSGTSNRRSRTYRKGPELRQHPSVSSPIGSSVTSDEFNYNAFRGGRRDRNYSFKDRNDLSRYHGSANSVVHQNQECTRSKAPLNLLHCDVWGPANVIGKRGEKYYLSVLDDYSRRMFIFPMCHKSDTYDILAKFIIRAERQLDLKVKAVRTDFGGEFIASILSDFFVERGIKQEKTNIYTPQQNGASERLNRTVINGARTVLSESGLDKSFWPEAVLYFVHVWNRLCHSGQTLTPIELYIGIKPSIRHLRPFGSTLYVGTPRPLRGKLDPKAKKGILVGFALGTRGYRVWIPEDSKVIETSNVRFQKPQQSNGGAVLASPNLKFSDYEVFENGDDDTDEDERVNSIPISLPQDSDSETEGENLSRTENSTVPVKTTWKRVVVPRADGSRNDIYFYEVGKSQRLRSCNEIKKKYCKDRNLEFDENIFSFKGKDTFEGIVNPQPSVSGVQSVKVKNNA